MGFIEGPPAPKRIWGPPFFISNFKFSWYKKPTGKIWKKIYCEFYFDGITLTHVGLIFKAIA